MPPPTKSGIDIDGAKALKAAFDEFPKRFVDKAIRQIHRKLMKIIVLPDIKRNIAVATGLAKSKLRVRAAKNKRGGRLPRGIFGASINFLELVHYAKWFLFSRRLPNGRIRPGDRTMRKALFDNRHRLRTAVNREYRAALPRIAAETRAKTKGKG